MVEVSVAAAEATAETGEAAKIEEAAPMGQVQQGARDMLQFRTVWRTNCVTVTIPMRIKLGTVLLLIPVHGRINVLQEHEISASLIRRRKTKIFNTTRCFPA